MSFIFTPRSITVLTEDAAALDYPNRHKIYVDSKRGSSLTTGYTDKTPVRDIKQALQLKETIKQAGSTHVSLEVASGDYYLGEEDLVLYDDEELIMSPSTTLYLRPTEAVEKPVIIQGSRTRVKGGRISSMQTIPFEQAGDLWVSYRSAWEVKEPTWRWAPLVKNGQAVEYSRWPKDGLRHVHVTGGGWLDTKVYQPSEFPPFHEGMLWVRSGPFPWLGTASQIISAEHYAQFIEGAYSGGGFRLDAPKELFNTWQNLDPGEFAYDPAGDRLVYAPLPEDSINACNFQVATCQQLLKVEPPGDIATSRDLRQAGIALDSLPSLTEVIVEDCRFEGTCSDVAWYLQGIGMQQGALDNARARHTSLASFYRAVVSVDRCSFGFSATDGVYVAGGLTASGSSIKNTLITDCDVCGLNVGDSFQGNAPRTIMLRDFLLRDCQVLSCGRRLWSAVNTQFTSVLYPVVEDCVFQGSPGNVVSMGHPEGSSNNFKIRRCSISGGHRKTADGGAMYTFAGNSDFDTTDPNTIEACHIYDTKTVQPSTPGYSASIMFDQFSRRIIVKDCIIRCDDGSAGGKHNSAYDTVALNNRIHNARGGVMWTQSYNPKLLYSHTEYDHTKLSWPVDSSNNNRNRTACVVNSVDIDGSTVMLGITPGMGTAWGATAANAPLQIVSVDGNTIVATGGNRHDGISRGSSFRPLLINTNAERNTNFATISNWSRSGTKHTINLVEENAGDLFHPGDVCKHQIIGHWGTVSDWYYRAVTGDAVHRSIRLQEVQLENSTADNIVLRCTTLNHISREHVDISNLQPGDEVVPVYRIIVDGELQLDAEQYATESTVWQQLHPAPLVGPYVV